MSFYRIGRVKNETNVFHISSLHVSCLNPNLQGAKNIQLGWDGGYQGRFMSFNPAI